MWTHGRLTDELKEIQIKSNLVKWFSLEYGDLCHHFYNNNPMVEAQDHDHGLKINEWTMIPNVQYALIHGFDTAALSCAPHISYRRTTYAVGYFS